MAKECVALAGKDRSVERRSTVAYSGFEKGVRAISQLRPHNYAMGMFNNVRFNVADVRLIHLLFVRGHCDWQVIRSEQS
ncbi:hypothetical protein M0804_000428 [Polistes exclamans]|nr:hypothetical protein M0804_000428 [Polistes exclamans]